MANTKIKSVAKIQFDLNTIVHLHKVFGYARAEQILKQEFKKSAKKLAQALAWLEQADEASLLASDTNTEVPEVLVANDVETSDCSVDKLTDKRVADSDHGVDRKQVEDLQSWLKYGKTSELRPVDFRDVFKTLTQDVKRVPATILRCGRFIDKFGCVKFVINLQLQPVYVKSHHRGFTFEPLAVFLNFKQFDSVCQTLGLDMDNFQSFRQKGVGVGILVNDAKQVEYFICK